MKRFLVITSFFSLFFIASSFACSRAVDANYTAPTMQQYYDSASLIFEGELISIDDSKVPENRQIYGNTKMSFQLNRVWKGDLKKGDKIDIYVYRSTCNPEFSFLEPGSHMVLYANPFFENSGPKNVPSGWRIDPESGSFQRDFPDSPQTKKIYGEMILELEQIANQQRVQHGAPPDAHSGRR